MTCKLSDGGKDRPSTAMRRVACKAARRWPPQVPPHRHPARAHLTAKAAAAGRAAGCLTASCVPQKPARRRRGAGGEARAPRRSSAAPGHRAAANARALLPLPGRACTLLKASTIAPLLLPLGGESAAGPSRCAWSTPQVHNCHRQTAGREMQAPGRRKWAPCRPLLSSLASHVHHRRASPPALSTCGAQRNSTTQPWQRRPSLWPPCSRAAGRAR